MSCRFLPSHCERSESTTAHATGLNISRARSCWESPAHPDPKGKQLATVAAALEQLQPKFGELFSEMGVFWECAIAPRTVCATATAPR